MKRLIVLTALALAPFAALAQVYKCVDSAGKTVYSQSPCPGGARASTLRRDPPSAPAAKSDAKGAAPKTSADLEQEFRKRRQEQAEGQKKQEQKLAAAREREENCRNARAQLASLEATPRQMRIDEKGERHYLDEAQVEREKDRARRAVQSFCN